MKLEKHFSQRNCRKKAESELSTNLASKHNGEMTGAYEHTAINRWKAIKGQKSTSFVLNLPLVAAVDREKWYRKFEKKIRKRDKKTGRQIC